MSLDPVAVALAAHSRGYIPVPIKPRRKLPAISNWQELSWDSEEVLREKFLPPDPDSPLNVGLVLGPRSGLVDIDLDHPRAVRLAEVLLPKTAMRHGRAQSPGSHYWYRVTDDHDPGVRRYQLPTTRATVIEYRGSGGQTVIPESLHPDGDIYRWEGEPWGGEEGPAEISGVELHAIVALIALVVTLADNWPAKGGRHDAYLALVGGLLRDFDGEGNPTIHPLWDHNIEGLISIISDLTADGDGSQTRVAESVPSTRKKLLGDRHTHGWPTLARLIGDDHCRAARELAAEIESLHGMERRKRPDPLSAPEPATDESPTFAEALAAAQAIPIEDRDPLAERINSWQPVDIGLMLIKGLRRPEANCMIRSDGKGLMYRGRINSLYGSGNSGKTWLAMHAAVQTMNSGGSCLLIDFEDEPNASLLRIKALLGGDEAPLLSGQFTYIAPEEPISNLHVDRWGQPMKSDRSMAASEMLTAALRHSNPDLLIVDGITTLYGIHALHTSDAMGTDAIGRWLRQLTNQNQRTVILIDHTAKDAAPGSTPQGSQHKIAMVQGSALQVVPLVRPRAGSNGSARIYVGKDRLGGIDSTSTDPEVAAEVKFVSGGPDDMKITIDPPNPQLVDVLATATARGRSKPSSGSSSPGRPRQDRGPMHSLILTRLRENSEVPKTRAEIQLATSLAGPKVSALLAELVDSGQVLRTGSGPSTRYQINPGSSSPDSD